MRTTDGRNSILSHTKHLFLFNPREINLQLVEVKELG
jgi:hypothetical protein